VVLRRDFVVVLCSGVFGFAAILGSGGVFGGSGVVVVTRVALFRCCYVMMVLVVGEFSLVGFGFGQNAALSSWW
jgi:hypothetical protein